MSEPVKVSDEILTELIHDAKMELKAWEDCVHNHESQSKFVQHGIDALEELQSRRAAEQAALPAVEEMVRSLIAFVERSTPDDGSYINQDCAKSLPKFFVPLFAKLARQAELLGECREIVLERRNAWVLLDNAFGTQRVKIEKAEEIDRLDAIIDSIDAELAKGGNDGNDTARGI